MTERFHVIAVPTDSEGTYEGSIIGEAATEQEAILICQQEGYLVIAADDGGNIDTYDAEDAPGIYGYQADGKGAIGVTVRIDDD